MNKRKTVNIRVHRMQRWSAKLAASKLDCPIHELINRVASGDGDAIEAWMEADKECRKRDRVT